MNDKIKLIGLYFIILGASLMAVFAGMEMYYVIGFTGVMIFIGLTLVVIGAIIFAYNDERKR